MTWADNAPAATVDADIYFDDADDPTPTPAPDSAPDTLGEIVTMGFALGVWAGSNKARYHAAMRALLRTNERDGRAARRLGVSERHLRRLIAEAKNIMSRHAASV